MENVLFAYTTDRVELEEPLKHQHSKNKRMYEGEVTITAVGSDWTICLSLNAGSICKIEISPSSEAI